MIDLKVLFNDRKSNFNRNRMIYLFFTLLIMCLGLASRKYIYYLPIFLGKYAGDTLWATMVYLGLAFIFNKFTTKRITIISLISRGMD